MNLIAIASLLGKRFTARLGGIKWANTGFCFAVFFLVIYLPFLISHLNTHKNDFSAVYIWSTAARTGLNPYTDNLTALEDRLGLDTNGNNHANYPPPLIVAFEPITLLSPTTAYWVWFSLSILAFMAALVIVCGRQLLWFMVLALLYEPLTDHFLWAQSYTIVLLLLAIALRAMTSGCDTIAGISLAAASALKLFPLVIVLYPVRTKRWSVVASATIALFTIAGISVAVLGWARAVSFFGSTPPKIWIHWAFAHSNVSIGAIMGQLFIEPLSKQSGSDRVVLLESIYATAALGVCAMAFLATPVSDPNLRAFGLWIIVATWIFPICWPAHMVLFLVFLAVLFCNETVTHTQLKGPAILVTYWGRPASDPLDIISSWPYRLAIRNGKALPHYFGPEYPLFSLAVF